jgi:mono/diheme cytochrome c family protein
VRSTWLPLLALLGSTVAAAASAQAARPAAPASPPAANVAKGKDVYLRFSCWACHGYAGHGGGGPKLVPSRLDLAGFTAFVRNPPTMPPYTAKVLSDAQLADVWAYLKTLPESPPARSIPLLNQP